MVSAAAELLANSSKLCKSFGKRSTFRERTAVQNNRPCWECYLGTVPQMETDQTMTLATICIMGGTAFQDDRQEWSVTYVQKTYSLVSTSLWLLPPWKFIQLSDTMTGQCLGLLTGQTIMQTIRFLLDHSRNGHGHKRFLCGLPTQKRDWNSCPRTIKLNSLRLILVV